MLYPFALDAPGSGTPRNHLEKSQLRLWTYAGTLVFLRCYSPFVDEVINAETAIIVTRLSGGDENGLLAFHETRLEQVSRPVS